MVDTLKCSLSTFINIIIELRVRLVEKGIYSSQIITLNRGFLGCILPDLSFSPVGFIQI